jgi:hypothetical protein
MGEEEIKRRWNNKKRKDERKAEMDTTKHALFGQQLWHKPKVCG